MLRTFAASTASSIFLLLSPAHAALPAPVKAMIEAAIESGNDDDVTSVVRISKVTNPDDHAEIEAMLQNYKEKQAQLAAREQQEKLQAGFFENWSGEGEAGAFRSTGNSSNTGLSGGIKFTKDAFKWRAKFRATTDYQRSNGTTTREQFRMVLEPNYKFSDRFYAYGLAQYERDRFQGFSARYTLSGGLGYTAIAKDKLSLDVKAGPAWRQTSFAGGGSDSSLAGLAGLDFAWRVSDTLKLTQSADATIASNSNTFNTSTALDAKLIGTLSARLSYSIEHETDPPVGRIKTDTLSRATLVYGF